MSKSVRIPPRPLKMSVLLRELRPYVYGDSLTDFDIRHVSTRFVRAIASGTPGIGDWFVQAFKGLEGDNMCLAAWSMCQNGLQVGEHSKADGYEPILSALADVCIRSGRLDVLRPIVKHGPPRRFLEDADTLPWSLEHQAGFLDSLTTLPYERLLGPLDEHRSMVALAAHQPEHYEAGLEFAFLLRPTHPDFEAFAADSSEAGARVRSFLMRKQIALHQRATSDVASPRRKLKAL